MLKRCDRIYIPYSNELEEAPEILPLFMDLQTQQLVTFWLIITYKQLNEKISHRMELETEREMQMNL
ncbi:hypothetical protein BpHYR1_034154 [Brachionus plicatilis]|uniref:Uncharacterized protein n=1 Tax=Brachionus plicatilis TaxID=10195 RepID=A0A3M7S6F7_BRAPC|nr:hypothetical protein BpHYR1_034154 [Brachionus plicatilis]